jgi:hypothetical protein
MASHRAAHAHRTRCSACGHAFLASARWGVTAPCPCCGQRSWSSQSWLLRGAELAAIGTSTFLFWAYWWF